MKRIMKTTAASVALVLAISGALYSQGRNGANTKNGHKRPALSGAGDALRRNMTVAVFIGTTNCGAGESSHIAALMEKEIGSAAGVRIVPTETTRQRLGLKPGAAPCLAARCADEYAAGLGADIVIVGSVDKIAQEYVKPLAKGEEYPYLQEVVKNEMFNCRFMIYSASQKRPVSTIFQKTKRKGLNDVAKKIAGALDAHLRAAGKNSGRPNVEVTVFGSGIFPVGKLRKIIRAGCGAGFNLALSRVLMANDVIMLSGKYDFYSFKAPGTTFYGSFDVMLLWGMSFSLAKAFRLVPLVGVGCQVSFARYDSLFNSSRYRYVDPEISVRLEGDIMLHRNVAIIITPEFGVFFEKKYVGLYAGAQAGLRFTF